MNKSRLLIVTLVLTITTLILVSEVVSGRLQALAFSNEPNDVISTNVANTGITGVFFRIGEATVEFGETIGESMQWWLGAGEDISNKMADSTTGDSRVLGVQDTIEDEDNSGNFIQKFLQKIVGWIEQSVDSSLAYSRPLRKTDTMVLGDNDSPLSLIVTVPAEFTDNLTVQGDFVVLGNIQAPNLITSITAGTGISVTEGIEPLLTNTDPGSAQSIFKQVQVGSSEDVTLTATLNNDLLKILAGDNISLSADEDDKSLTINAAGITVDYTKSGWTWKDDVLYFTDEGNKVGIGTDSPSTKLHVVGATTLAGTVSITDATSFSSSIIVGGATSLNGGLTVSGATIIDSGIANTSGLKLASLNSSSPVGVGGGKVLSVDNAGNIILVTDESGAGELGDILPPGSVEGATLYYDGTTWGHSTNLFHDGGKVGISTDNPNGRLHVYTNDADTVGISVQRINAQSANFMEFLDSDGSTVLSYIDEQGVFNGTINASGSINPGFSTGAVLFQGTDGMSADVNNFYWDDSTNRFGIGDNTPAAMLTVGSGDLFQVNSSGIVNAPDGTNAAPTYSFVSDPDTGLYRSADNQIGLAIAGTLSYTLDAAALRGVYGTSALPGFSFVSDNNTGMFGTGSDILGFSTNGVERARFNASGYLGLGTNNPLALFHASTTSTSFPSNGVGYFDWSPTASTTTAGDLFKINLGANGSVGSLFKITDNGSTLFSVTESKITSALPHEFTAAGDVSFAYDIQFTNSTASYIKSYSSLYLESGDSTTNNDLTLRTWGTGDVIADMGGNFQLISADPTLIFNTSTATDTDYWMGVNEDAGGDDDDSFQIGKGTVLGTNTYLTLTSTGSLGIGTTGPDRKLDVVDATNPQARLSYTDGSIYTDLQTNASGYFIISPSGNNTSITGNLGVGSTAPDAALEINHATGDNLRLSYDDSDGSATNYVDFATSSSGDLTITPSGGAVNVAGNLGLSADAYINWGATAGESGYGFRDNSGTVQYKNSGGSWANVGTGSVSTWDQLQAPTTNLTLNLGTYTSTFNSSATTTNPWTLNADSLTTGTAHSISVDALTTGTGFALSSTSTVLSTGKLLSLDWSPTGSTEIFATGDLFSINAGQYGNVGALLNIMDNGSSVFKITQSKITSSLPHEFTSAGDVSFAYNINMTNSTASYINSSAPLYLQSGPYYANHDLTMRTYGTGDLVADIGGNFQISSADPAIVFNTTSATDTDFWMGITEDGGGDDDDLFQIGKGTVIGSNTYLTLASTGSLGVGTAGPDRKLDILDTTNPQLRLTHTDGSVYADIQADSSGNLVFTTTGSTVTFTGDTLVASDFSCTDCLDFTELADALTLDATTTFNLDSNNADLNFDNATLFLDSSTNSIGIGTATPTSKFHLTGSFAGNALATLNETGSNDILTASASGVAKLTLSNAGNLGLGTSTFGTDAAGVLAIAGSTAPSTAIVDGIQLFAVEETGSHELRVMDEAGNITTLSPHNFSLIGTPSEEMAWSYYSERNGLAINADMTKALRLIEALSGERLIHIEDLQSGEDLSNSAIFNSLNILSQQQTSNAITKIEDAQFILEGKVLGLESNVSDLSDEIDSQASQIESLKQSVENLSVMATQAAELLALGGNDSDLGEYTGLSLISESSDSAIVSGNLHVLGESTFGDLSVTGDLRIGMISIDPLEASIQALTALKIQPLAIAGVEFVGGNVVIDQTGNISVAGEVRANKFVVNQTEENTADTAGKAEIAAGQVEIEIETEAVTENSLVFLTATSDLGQSSLIVSKVNPGIGFTAKLSTSKQIPVSFNWLIIDAVTPAENE